MDATLGGDTPLSFSSRVIGSGLMTIQHSPELAGRLVDAVCDPTPASQRAIRLWHPSVDG
jgi:hypothetical protein